MLELLVVLVVEGTTGLPFWEGALFGADGHDHCDDQDDDHGTIDLHARLDPVNAGIWLGKIALKTAAQGPENTDIYLKTAMERPVEIATVHSQISDLIDPLKGTRFMVIHDAYHYFEVRFGIEAVVEGTDTKVEVLDPMGVYLPQGPELYAGLLLQMATPMSGCAK